MIPFEQAFRIAMDAVCLLGSEEVNVQSACNRILAGDVVSDIDMPPFNKSAMDGYACRREDLANELKIVDYITAGKKPEASISRNQCAKIMTGATVPDGADCVIMVEDTENPDKDTVRFTGTETRDNICAKAEDIVKGEVVLHEGDRILPQHIAVLAAVGCVRPRVIKRPRVGIIATGNELVEPDRQPAESEIRDSNSFQLNAHVAAMGGIPLSYGIARDRAESINALLKRSLTENEVTVVSGGVSMGDLDLVPDMLRRCGVELLFEKVAVKPGKPTVFGVCDDSFVFGLPGNPVSTFIIFELLVKPFMLKMMGHHYRPPCVLMPLGAAVRRKRAFRQSWLPCRLTADGKVETMEYHGSAHIGALSSADGIIAVPVGVKELSEGTVVNVRLIRD